MGFRTNNSQSKRYIVIDLCNIKFQFVYQVAWSETKRVFHHMTKQRQGMKMFSAIWPHNASPMEQKTLAILYFTGIFAPW